MELMKLKPPPNITTPVATATGTGQQEADICLSWKREENKCLYMHHTIACLMKTSIKSCEKIFRMFLTKYLYISNELIS